MNLKRMPKLAVFVLALSATLLIVCDGDDPAGPTGDRIRPTVKVTSPPDGVTGVAVDMGVSVTFSEPIDTASVDSSTFILDEADGAFAFGGNTVTLTPDSLLTYSTVYTATVTTGITDTSGNGLAEPYSWSFTTVDDPATLPPTVVFTDPADGATGAYAPVSATFSKAMDAATLTPSSFGLIPSAGGVVTYSAMTATFIPDDTLEYNSLYTATITTAVADTSGIHLESDYSWEFTTGPDPMIPVAALIWPPDSAIIGDSVTVTVEATHPVGISHVEFYKDGLHLGAADDSLAPYEYFWDASTLAIADVHTLLARAYDSAGRVGISDTVTVFYRWEALIADGNDPWRTDIARALARSTSTLLEMRYEFSESWYNPYDTILDDTTLDLGIYFDTDQSQLSGRTDFAGTQLNDIGAEYRVIIGLHGVDTALAVWQGSVWQPVFDIEGFAYLSLPPDTNVLEFGIKWSDLPPGPAVDIVSINLFFRTSTSFYPDWVPNQGQGHVTVRRAARYIGEGYSGGSPRMKQPENEATVMRENPFNDR